ncbi:MAG: CDP-glycerol glycerophosphotransferase family protein [bacterium]
MYKILFELTQEYYLPSFLPIYEEMKKDSGFDIFFRVGPNQKRYLGIFLIKQKRKIEAKLKKRGLKITDTYKNYDAVICGTTLKNPQKYGKALLCNVDHGPGLKTLRYREFLKQKSTHYHIFVEGQYRIDKFKKYGLDAIEEIHEVGLPKLDPYFQGDYNPDIIIRKYDLDPRKKTVLYAPSYRPTSIFEIAQTIPTLMDDYNVMVKLHPYSWQGKYVFENNMNERISKETISRVMSQVINSELLNEDNCSLILYDLDYSTLIHSDGQPLLEDDTKDWLKESFVHINNPGQLKSAVEEALYPSAQRIKALKKDRDYIFSYTDGQAGKRVKRVIEELLKKREQHE